MPGASGERGVWGRPRVAFQTDVSRRTVVTGRGELPRGVLDRSDVLIPPSDLRPDYIIRPLRHPRRPSRRSRSSNRRPNRRRSPPLTTSPPRKAERKCHSAALNFRRLSVVRPQKLSHRKPSRGKPSRRTQPEEAESAEQPSHRGTGLLGHLRRPGLRPREPRPREAEPAGSPATHRSGSSKSPPNGPAIMGHGCVWSR